MTISIVSLSLFLIAAGVMLLPVLVDAPLVRAPVLAHLAAELGLRVHALELAMPPQGPPHRVILTAVRAHVELLARLAGPRRLLMMV